MKLHLLHDVVWDLLNEDPALAEIPSAVLYEFAERILALPLLAAAPEMLGELRRIALLAEANGGGFTDKDGLLRTVRELGRVARAAIAKAEGRTQ